MKVSIRRQWNDYRVAETDFDNLDSFHWSDVSGGVFRKSPQPFIHAYVHCDQIDGEIAHSGTHGPCPHNIKVCIVKKDNSIQTWEKVLEIAGPKPEK